MKEEKPLIENEITYDINEEEVVDKMIRLKNFT